MPLMKTLIMEIPLEICMITNTLTQYIKTVYDINSLLMYVIGQKKWISMDITHSFCFHELVRIKNCACLGGIS